jgi:branched-chain amino acid aminotransferase
VTGICKKFKPYPMQYYARGIHLVQSKVRKHSQDPLSTVKTLSFLPYIAARRWALSQTAHDALLLNEHGRVAEASTSNVFARRGDTVHAPGAGEGAIPGVTRQAVLELVEDAGLRFKEPLTLQELAGADEAWLTNTTGGIVPVTKFLESRIGDGAKGETTTDLSHALEAAIRNHA